MSQYRVHSVINFILSFAALVRGLEGQRNVSAGLIRPPTDGMVPSYSGLRVPYRH